MKKIIVFTILIFILLGNLSFCQDKTTYKVIVNKSNNVASLTKSQVAKLFFKKITKWDDGTIVLPVDLIDSSPIRKKFSQQVLKKKIAAVKAYWQKMIFSGRAAPPPEKRTYKEVLIYVDENPGAIGYVAASTNLGNYGVKVVKVE